MQINEGLIIPPRTRAAYWTNKQHMLASGIPSWSKASRDATQTFLPTLLNKTAQCKYASKQESICSLMPDRINYHYINPWLGGAFNVLEASDDGQTGGCDTTLLDEQPAGFNVNPVVIDPTCLVDAPQCKVPIGNSSLGDSTANVCVSRQGQLPKFDTVPRSSMHNTCMQKPKQLPSTCTHLQGMLYGLDGKPVRDLYNPVPAGTVVELLDPGERELFTCMCHVRRLMQKVC